MAGKCPLSSSNSSPKEQVTDMNETNGHFHSLQDTRNQICILPKKYCKAILNSISGCPLPMQAQQKNTAMCSGARTRSLAKTRGNGGKGGQNTAPPSQLLVVCSRPKQCACAPFLPTSCANGFVISESHCRECKRCIKCNKRYPCTKWRTRFR